MERLASQTTTNARQTFAAPEGAFTIQGQMPLARTTATPARRITAIRRAHAFTRRKPLIRLATTAVRLPIRLYASEHPVRQDGIRTARRSILAILAASTTATMIKNGIFITATNRRIIWGTRSRYAPTCLRFIALGPTIQIAQR